MSSLSEPKCVLLFSGKRKSGKDYFTDNLLKDVRQWIDVAVIKISGPIKSHYASTYNLSFEDLMGSGEYKERYRSEMIKWSDEERLKDPGIFCRQAVKMYEAEQKEVWVVSDVRRKTDIAWFKAMYGNSVKTVRMTADEETRVGRGFVFTDGVDNVTSECDLDDVDDFDWVFDNSNGTIIDVAINTIKDHIRRAINS